MSQFYLLFYLIFFVFFCLKTETKAQNIFKCDKSADEEADRMVGKLMTIGEVDLRFPESNQEMIDFCRNETILIDHLENYKSQCLHGRTKQIVSVIIYSIKNMVRMYCRRPDSKRTQELLSSTPCANAAHSGYYYCQQTYRNKLANVDNKQLLTFADSKVYLAQICCDYLNFIQCMQQVGSEHEPICLDHHIELNILFVKNIFGNAVNLLCNEYTEDSDRCKKYQMIRVDKKDVKNNSTGTFFTPLLSLLSKL